MKTHIPTFNEFISEAANRPYGYINNHTIKTMMFKKDGDKVLNFIHKYLGDDKDQLIKWVAPTDTDYAYLEKVRKKATLVDSINVIYKPWGIEYKGILEYYETHKDKEPMIFVDIPDADYKAFFVNDLYLGEAVAYFKIHPKNKGKMGRKLTDESELNHNDVYMIVTNERSGKFWTHSWKFIKKWFNKEYDTDFYRFETDNGYSESVLEIDRAELDLMIRDKEIAAEEIGVKRMANRKLDFRNQ